MVFTITLILSILVSLNFVLLVFSCNKHPKEQSTIQTNRTQTEPRPLTKDNQNTTELLATGS